MGTPPTYFPMIPTENATKWSSERVDLKLSSLSSHYSCGWKSGLISLLLGTAAKKQKAPSSSARHWGWLCYPSKKHFPLPCFHHLIFAFIQKTPGRTRYRALQLHTEYTCKQSLLEPKWTLLSSCLKHTDFNDILHQHLVAVSQVKL